MKKFISVFLALVMILSTSALAFAADVYTCPTCNKKYESLDGYNTCVEGHNAENTEKAPDAVYDCATCGKKFDNLEDYNACVDSHYNNINHHYDKYVGATVIELINAFIDIFNDIGFKDLFVNVIEKVYSLVMGAVEA